MVSKPRAMSEEGESQIQFPVGAQGTTLSPVLGDATLQLASASHSQQTKRKRQRMLLGLMLLGLVVFLWVSSSELIQVRCWVIIPPSPLLPQLQGAP